MEIDYGADNCI